MLPTRQGGAWQEVYNRVMAEKLASTLPQAGRSEVPMDDCTTENEGDDLDTPGRSLPSSRCRGKFRGRVMARETRWGASPPSLVIVTARSNTWTEARK